MNKQYTLEAAPVACAKQIKDQKAPKAKRIVGGSDLRADRQYWSPRNLRPRRKSGRLGDPTLPATTKEGSANGQYLALVMPLPIATSSSANSPNVLVISFSPRVLILISKP